MHFIHFYENIMSFGGKYAKIKDTQIKFKITAFLKKFQETAEVILNNSQLLYVQYKQSLQKCSVNFHGPTGMLLFQNVCIYVRNFCLMNTHPWLFSFLLCFSCKKEKMRVTPFSCGDQYFMMLCCHDNMIQTSSTGAQR